MTLVNVQYGTVKKIKPTYIHVAIQTDRRTLASKREDAFIGRKKKYLTTALGVKVGTFEITRLN